MQLLKVKGKFSYMVAIVNGPLFALFCERCETRNDYDMRKLTGAQRPQDFDMVKGHQIIKANTDTFHEAHKHCTPKVDGIRICAAKENADKGIDIWVDGRLIPPTVEDEWPEEIQNA